MPQARANEIDIEYETFGREGDPLVLLIMGLAAQLNFWPESLCEGLAAKGFRVVRFDNRDIGKSTHLTSLPTPDFRAVMAEVIAGATPAVPYQLDDMAKDAVGLLDALGAERAHVAGSSMGGMIAQLVAINHPERTKSLISMNSTTGRYDLPPGDPKAMQILAQPPKSSGREDLIEASILVQRTLLGPGFGMTETSFASPPSGEPIARPMIQRELRANGRRSSRRGRATRASTGALPGLGHARRRRSALPGRDGEGYG